MQFDMQSVWRAWAAGDITDEAAQAAAERHAAPGAAPSPSRTFRPISAYPVRRPQRSPDRQASIERRRRLAASGPMPPTLACKFTVGELAALRIIGDEVREHGCCYRHIDAIAARSGVSRSTVQRAVRQAQTLGFLRLQERRRRGLPSLTNIIRIVSREWLMWLDRGGGCQKRNISVSRNQNKWKSRRLLTVSPQRFVGVALERDATPEKHHDNPHSRQRRKGNRRSEIDDLPGD